MVKQPQQQQQQTSRAVRQDGDSIVHLVSQRKGQTDLSRTLVSKRLWLFTPAKLLLDVLSLIHRISLKDLFGFNTKVILE